MTASQGCFGSPRSEANTTISYSHPYSPRPTSVSASFCLTSFAQTRSSSAKAMVAHQLAVFHTHPSDLAGSYPSSLSQPHSFRLFILSLSWVWWFKPITPGKCHRRTEVRTRWVLQRPCFITGRKWLGLYRLRKNTCLMALGSTSSIRGREERRSLHVPHLPNSREN